MIKFLSLFLIVFVGFQEIWAERIIIQDLAENESQASFLVKSNEIQSFSSDFSYSTKFFFNLISFEYEKISHEGPYLKVFHELKSKGLLTTRKIGSPSLFFQSALLKGRVKDIQFKVKKGESKSFPWLFPMPGKKYPCRCSDVFFSEILRPKISLYKKKNALFNLKYLGDFRGTPVSKLNLFPGQFTIDKGYTLYPKISFETKSNLMKFSSSEKVYSDPVYLIIGPEKLLSSEIMKKYFVWKKDQGYDVKSFFMEKIGKTFEDFQSFFKSYYLKKKFEYALIIGDEDVFPTHYIVTRYDFNTPSDLPYFTMGGDDDYIPDVYYGRFSVANLKDLTTQITKVLDFEQIKMKHLQGTYLGLASNEGDSPSDFSYLQKISLPFLKNLDWGGVLISQNDRKSSADFLNESFSNGVNWVNYLGHGTGYSWASLDTGSYSFRDIQNIEFSNKLPIIIDISCRNGRFNKTKNSLGTSFVNASNLQNLTGAVAYYGGSADISWHAPAVMALGISKELIDKKPSTLGEALFLGQMYLMENYDDTEEIIENLHWFHLQGDPTLRIEHFN